MFFAGAGSPESFFWDYVSPAWDMTALTGIYWILLFFTHKNIPDTPVQYVGWLMYPGPHG